MQEVILLEDMGIVLLDLAQALGILQLLALGTIRKEQEVL